MSTPQVSKRAKDTIASPMRKFLPLMKEAEARGTQIIKLNIGNPDIEIPKEFMETVKKYDKKTLGYAPSSGIPEHVDAWIKYYSYFDIDLEPSNIIPTQGAAEAILLSMLAVADVDDEIIVFEPLYAAYKGFSTMTGIKLIPITLNVDDAFALPSDDEILNQISDRTKAIVVITPDNPSGKVWEDKEINRIIKIAKDHNLFIISDETYREIVFENTPNSLLKYPEAKNISLVLDTVSKRFSLTGARIGCVVSYNEEVMASILKFAMARLSVPTLEQLGTIPLLENPKEYTEKIIQEYRLRRDVVYKGLKDIPGVVCHQPQGAFYVIAKLPVEDAEDFVSFLLKDFEYQGKTLMLTPIKDFYITEGLGKSEVRIAYVVNQEELEEAMFILKMALEKYLS